MAAMDALAGQDWQIELTSQLQTEELAKDIASFIEIGRAHV